MNLLQSKECDNQNRNWNISGTAHLSDMFLYAKQTGRHPISAHIKHRTIEIIIINKIKENRCRMFFGTPCMIQLKWLLRYLTFNMLRLFSIGDCLHFKC